MRLRPIQQVFIDKIYSKFRDGHRKILAMAPTGFGKTIVAKTLIDSCVNKNNRALFTVPRINLISQTAAKFDQKKYIYNPGQFRWF